MLLFVTGLNAELFMKSIARVSSGIIGALLLAGGADAQQLSGGALVKALRRGGSSCDMPVRLARRPTNKRPIPPERQLDETGGATAQAMGKALRDLKLPIGEVCSSPTYRALETVRLEQFGTPQPYSGLGDGGQSMQVSTEAQSAWLQKKVTQFPMGTNTLIITHFPNMSRAFPQSVAGLADGEADLWSGRQRRKSGRQSAATLVARVKIEERRTLRP